MPNMGWRGWNSYEEEAHERWHMLPWCERFHWPGVVAFVLILVLAAMVLWANIAHAASLTLGCSGTVATTAVPKNGVAGDPQKENLTEMSVVIDFDKRTVAGLWAEMNGFHTQLPITAVDANSVTFKGRRKYSVSDSSIEGTVDRITGHVDATETVLWSNGGLSMMTYDLSCKPTKPLF